MRRLILALGLLVSVAGCATAPKPAGPPPGRPMSLAEALGMPELATGGRASGADLERRIAEASRHPLGSRENPVRVSAPQGQRAYLARLRCTGGQAPSFQRVGNFGFGVFGSIIDGYDVRCAGGEPRQSMIFMDMYHPGHDEQGAPAGFTLVRPGEQAI